MTDFPVAKNSYVAFDGLTIKEKMRERLNQTGIFTDQNFEGSNLAGFNDALAMGLSLVLYYVNQQSSNDKFATTKLYDIMNNVVKEIGYSPTGHQTASVNFTLSANSNISTGIYTIPRYSSIDIAGISYSLQKDLSFNKTTNEVEKIQNIEDDSVLYQGSFIEFPTYYSNNTNNETILVSVDDGVLVDNFNISVYVKIEGVWSQWNRTQSLFLNNYNDKVYELRFNNKKRYEIKFGDDINGKKLPIGSEVAIYYLASDGSDGEIGVGALNGKKLTSNITNRLSEILSDVSGLSYMDDNTLTNLSLSNPFTSTYYNEPESVDSIRHNAPSVFRSQLSLTTTKSVDTFIRSNFSNIIHDIKVKNNKEYLDSYIKYFYDLGITKPQLESRALFNHLRYSDSCSFNNIYIFTVPKSIHSVPSYLTPSQKSLIVNSLQEEKVATSEIVPMDPVFIYFDIGFPDYVEIGNTSACKIIIKKSISSKKSDSYIKTEINSLINSFFAPANLKLGQTLNFQQLYTDILNIEGVDRIFTSYGTVKLEGLYFVQWNPIYFNQTIKQSETIEILGDFQFPIAASKDFVDRIEIQ